MCACAGDGVDKRDDKGMLWLLDAGVREREKEREGGRERDTHTHTHTRSAMMSACSGLLMQVCVRERNREIESTRRVVYTFIYECHEFHIGMSHELYVQKSPVWALVAWVRRSVYQNLNHRSLVVKETLNPV